LGRDWLAASDGLYISAWFEQMQITEKKKLHDAVSHLQDHRGITGNPRLLAASPSDMAVKTSASSLCTCIILLPVSMATIPLVAPLALIINQPLMC